MKFRIWSDKGLLKPCMYFSKNKIWEFLENRGVSKLGAILTPSLSAFFLCDINRYVQLDSLTCSSDLNMSCRNFDLGSSYTMKHLKNYTITLNKTPFNQRNCLSRGLFFFFFFSFLEIRENEWFNFKWAVSIAAEYSVRLSPQAVKWRREKAIL